MRRRTRAPDAVGVKTFVFSVASYVIFLFTLAAAILFLTGPVDHGTVTAPAAAAVIDVGLLGLFAVQHTVMARRGFKTRLTRLLPAAAERSLFVLAASASLLVLFWQWRPLPAVVLSVTGPQATALWAVYAIGWLIVIASTLMIDHFDLFGIRQGWFALRGRPYVPLRFQTRWLYSRVRHPLMTGFLVAIWATPRMTAGHLLFAAASTGYILVGVWFEERDLMRELPEYIAYRARVGAFLPRLRRSAGLRSERDQAVPGPDGRRAAEGFR
jgi:protein-S-isoprenylcysteine O-methyltransferase Ste14